MDILYSRYCMLNIPSFWTFFFSMVCMEMRTSKGKCLFLYLFRWLFQWYSFFRQWGFKNAFLQLGSISKENGKMRWRKLNYWSRWFIDISLTLFRMSLFKAAYGWFWRQKDHPPTLPPSSISHIFHNDETWQLYLTCGRSKK